MKMQIQREIEINASTEKVYSVLSDLSHWNTWSPWFHCEPTAKTEIIGLAREPGQAQSWEGQVIGAGRMTLRAFRELKDVKFDLEFFKPWKSQAEVIFKIEKLSEKKCKVVWVMNSSLPIFMVFFKKTMAAYIGNDFSRGLKMLKELCETDTVLTKSEYRGQVSQNEFWVMGRSFSCNISDIPQKARSEFQKLDELRKSGELTDPSGMTTLSHVHDIPKGVCEMTCGLAYSSPTGVKVPPGYELTHLASHKALSIKHLGTYQNIGNAWSMAASYQRGLKMKISKKHPAYEIYRTMPGQVADREIHTDIYMPIRD